MPRTVIPPQPGAVRGARDGTAGDGIPDKLIKYVPAETLAFFVPVAALIGNGEDTWLAVVLVVAVIGSVGYLYRTAIGLPAEQRPLWHFYVLSVVAFVAWAVATSAGAAALFGLSEKATSVILLAAVFLIPLADGLGNTVFARRPAAP